MELNPRSDLEPVMNIEFPLCSNLSILLRLKDLSALFNSLVVCVDRLETGENFETHKTEAGERCNFVDAARVSNRGYLSPCDLVNAPGAYRYG